MQNSPVQSQHIAGNLEKQISKVPVSNGSSRHLRKRLTAKKGGVTAYLIGVELAQFEVEP
jgi:hypothetical protein